MDTERQAAQDSIHDLIKDSVETIGHIRYGDISRHECDKLLRELQDNLWNIDTLRRMDVKRQEAQDAQDAIHDLIKDSVETIGHIRYGDISRHESDKLLRELQDNLWNIDTLRRRC